MTCTSCQVVSNFAPLEEVKVPVSNSAEFLKKCAPWRILGWLGLSALILERQIKKKKIAGKCEHLLDEVSLSNTNLVSSL